MWQGSVPDARSHRLGVLRFCDELHCNLACGSAQQREERMARLVV
jgi:hypothetical protein